MAQTFTHAFAAVAGEALDERAGFVKPLPQHAPVPLLRREHWADFNYYELVRVMEQIANTTDSSIHDSEEAVHETIARLLERDPERFDETDAMGLLGLIHSIARKYVLCIKAERMGVTTLSLNALVESATEEDGDEVSAMLNSPRIAPAVAHFKMGVDEDARFTLPPKPREEWNRSQAVGAAQRFRDKTGRAPTSAEFGRRGSGLPKRSILKRLGFKGINDLLLEAGVPIENPTRTRAKWLALDSAHACHSHRRRTGFWPNCAEARRLPAGTLPPENTMAQQFGGSTSEKVQRGVEDILGPIDQPTWKPSGELTARLRRAWLGGPQAVAA